MKKQDINKHFLSKSRLRFLTLRAKPDDKSKNKIDYVRKLITKYSDSCFITRESNKQNRGYHFHAIYCLRPGLERPKSFFKKGVHMHEVSVGDVNKEEKKEKKKDFSKS